MESLWIKTESDILKNDKKLEEEIKADVCIIGGGITGISTAYYLSQENYKVVILDREKIAYKTTGHTTAKITSQHGLFYNYLINDFGKEYAKDYYNANQEAIENIAKIIEKENINCDFKRQDSYVFTRSQEEVSKIKEEVKAVKEIGGEAEFVDKIEPPIENVLRCHKV